MLTSIKPRKAHSRIILKLNDTSNLLDHSGAIEVDFASLAHFDFASFERIESVVAAHFDTISGEYLRTSLAHDNRTYLCKASIRELHSQIFWVGISPVFSCTGGFFMGHNGVSINQYGRKRNLEREVPKFPR